MKCKAELFNGSITYVNLKSGTVSMNLTLDIKQELDNISVILLIENLIKD